MDHPLATLLRELFVDPFLCLPRRLWLRPPAAKALQDGGQIVGPPRRCLVLWNPIVPATRFSGDTALVQIETRRHSPESLCGWQEHLEAQIGKRTYELYISRGSDRGQDAEDGLRARGEVLLEILLERQYEKSRGEL